jgi:hypothetical protein
VKLQQPDLFGNEPRELSDRQQAAYDLVCNTPGGVTADEVGANWHAIKGKHHPDVRCQFCADDGASVLRTKALAGKVVRRRGGQWEPSPADSATVTDPVRKPLREPSEAELQANPFVGLDE